MTVSQLSVVALPGDGIGPEVMAEGLKILDTALQAAGIRYEVKSIECGGQYYLEHGTDWPEGSEAICAKSDLILLGAVGWPDPKGSGPVTMSNGRMAGYSPVIGNRVNLDLFANVRPVKLFPGVKHRIHGEMRQVWEPGKVDMVIIRENTEDLYCGIGGVLERAGVKQVAIDNRVITREGSERVIRHAFELARSRDRGAPHDGKKRVTAIVKDNVLDGCRMFRDIFYEIGKEYPEIEQEHAITDAFTQWLITKPEWYDVVVTTNMFGDIVTDLASVLQGGMGMAVGCNVGANHAMFEPIHGSAPTRVGNHANPLAMILAVKEGLAWVAQRHELPKLAPIAEAIEEAVIATLEDGQVLTYDLVGTEKASGTRAVGDEVNRHLEARLQTL
ncbi:MAG: isocitrate/isopropylmalate dehydrogenase family protein [Planctomycetes bacterium]|nr:isocitrate/isopropylmalate dehydrogenase family protein [Planctomycetota bacterium]